MSQESADPSPKPLASAVFPDRMKAARKALNMTQREIVERLAQRGLTTYQPTVATWEKKGKQSPSLDEFWEITEILRVPAHQLCDAYYLPPPEWEELNRAQQVKEAERSREEIDAEAIDHEVARQEGTIKSERENHMTPQQLAAIRSRIDEVEEQIEVCQEFISKYGEVEPDSPDIEIDRKELLKLEAELEGLRA